MDICPESYPGVSSFTWCRPDVALASSMDLNGWPYVWVPHVNAC
mgnify:FL=1